MPAENKIGKFHLSVTYLCGKTIDDNLDLGDLSNLDVKFSASGICASKRGHHVDFLIHIHIYIDNEIYLYIYICILYIHYILFF